MMNYDASEMLNGLCIQYLPVCSDKVKVVYTFPGHIRRRSFKKYQTQNF